MTSERPLRSESGLTPVPDPDGLSPSTAEAEAMAIRDAIPQVVRGDVQQPAVPRQVRPSRSSTKDRVPAAKSPPATAATTTAPARKAPTTTPAARPVRLLTEIAVVAAAVAVY